MLHSNNLEKLKQKTKKHVYNHQVPMDLNKETHMDATFLNQTNLLTKIKNSDILQNFLPNQTHVQARIKPKRNIT